MVTPLVQELETSPSVGWRFKLGTAVFVLAFAIWLLVPLAASLGAPAARTAALSGFIFVANKILLVLCVAVMGKAGFQRLKSVAFGHAKSLSPLATVGPTRHAVGLVMFCLPLAAAMLAPYIDILWPGSRPTAWQFEVLVDLMLIASFIVLGGDFWNKLQALFVRTARVVDVGD
jgi:hypothetical protein